MARTPATPHRPRPSGCIDRSQAFERERIAGLSVEERILLALGLRDRLAGLAPSARGDRGDAESGQPARGR